MSTIAMITTIGALFMGILAMFIRAKSAKKPASVKKIILPPVFMSSGFLMFYFIEDSIPPTLRIVEAVIVGMLISIFLIKTSKFEIKGNQIYLKRSKAFMFILSGMLLARIIFKIIIGDAINIAELGGMFFLLAYGMIVPWRISMYLSFKKVEKELKGDRKISSPIKT